MMDLKAIRERCHSEDGRYRRPDGRVVSSKATILALCDEADRLAEEVKRLRAFMAAIEAADEYSGGRWGEWGERAETVSEMIDEAFRVARTEPTCLAATPDTGWRDRAPTPEEHEIHRGPWLYVLKSDATLHLTWCREYRGPSCWRPLTSAGDPAPWPKEEE